MHWSYDSDTWRLRKFMRQMISRSEKTAKSMNLHHPYLFLSHCYEEQTPLLSYGAKNLKRLHQIRQAVDPEGIFQQLKVGQQKLGMAQQYPDGWSEKAEL